MSEKIRYDIERYGFKEPNHVMVYAKWRTQYGRRCIMLYASRPSALGDKSRWTFQALQHMSEDPAQVVMEGIISGGRCRVIRLLGSIRETLIARATRHAQRAQ